MNKEIYISKECWGKCQICGEKDDLRHGVCFDCASNVKVDKNGVCKDTISGKTWLTEE